MSEIYKPKPTPYKTRIKANKQRSIRERESRVSKGQVNFTKDNEYYTPKSIVRYFGKFDYDPATTKEKAKELCDDEKTRTLKHELTHCYIWEMGFYNVEFKWEEQICDFVATIHDFMNEVLGVDKE